MKFWIFEYLWIWIQGVACPKPQALEHPGFPAWIGVTLPWRMWNSGWCTTIRLNLALLDPNCCKSLTNIICSACVWKTGCLWGPPNLMLDHNGFDWKFGTTFHSSVSHHFPYQNDCLGHIPQVQTQCSYQNCHFRIHPQLVASPVLLAHPPTVVVGSMPFFLGMILSTYSMNHKADMCHVGRSPFANHHLPHFPKYHTTVKVIPSPKYPTRPKWSQVQVDILLNYGFFGSVE